MVQRRVNPGSLYQNRGEKFSERPYKAMKTITLKALNLMVSLTVRGKKESAIEEAVTVFVSNVAR